MRPPPEPVARLLQRVTLAARRFVTGRTPFGPQYEWLARRFWAWWERARTAGPPAARERLDPYVAWLAVNPWGPRSAAQLADRLLAASGRLPKLSVVMPVHDPPPPLLAAALDSVERQAFPDWELCVTDDASRDPAVRALLEERAARDPRIRVCRREERGGIVAATNAAAALARGEFLAFLDHDDLLHPAALGEAALALADSPEADLLYTDDDKVDEGGRRFAPQFKPDWSPELLLSHMYLSHLLVVRRALFEALGGLRQGFDGAQDFDLALRAGERARSVVHVPLVLYHWRARAGSTAVAGDAKPAGFEAGRRAVAEALERRGVVARVERPAWAVAGRLGLFEPDFPDDGPPVAVLIPSARRGDLLRRCLESLRRTRYLRFRVVVVDTSADGSGVPRELRGLADEVLALPPLGERFSFSATLNQAAARAGEELLLFLNDDTEALEPRWLSQMVGYAGLPGVGAVGAKLLFPDGRVQHAGVVRAAHHGLPGHAFKLHPGNDNGYLSLAAVARNCSAVTAACLLTPRALFEDVGGFDASRFPVAYGDADYCFRLAQRGFRAVYCPSARLLHHEGASRGFDDDPREAYELRRAQPSAADAYYSPHLDPDAARFEIRPRRVALGRVPPPRTDLWGHALDRTGAPLHQLELAEGLLRRGALRPSVVCTADGPLRAAFERCGVAIRVRPHPLAGVGETGYDAALESLASELRASGAQVVHANTLDTFYVVDAAARAGLPSLWNVHEAEGAERYFAAWPAWLAARARACFDKPYRVLFVSDAAREAFAPLDGARRFAVIHNGLHPGRFPAGGAAGRAQARHQLGIAEGDLLLLALGTVCERKGQHDLARALALLPPRLAARARCLFVGERDLPYARRLRELLAELPEPWRARTTLLPETDAPGRYFAAADAFVCTSRVESYPRVILEAMAHGLPILTTPVFGIREQVREGRNALFYAPGDAPGLADALQRLIEDAALRARLAGNAPLVLGTLTSFDEMLDAYAEAFREAYLSAG